MRCEICNKEIIYEMTFQDLFSFKYICTECINNLRIKETIIPIDYGYLMHYIYYTLDNEIGVESDDYLNQKIVDFIFKNRRKMILFYDEEEELFYDFLNFKEDIILIKKCYIELEKNIEKMENS